MPLKGRRTLVKELELTVGGAKLQLSASSASSMVARPSVSEGLKAVAEKTEVLVALLIKIRLVIKDKVLSLKSVGFFEILHLAQHLSQALMRFKGATQLIATEE